ncbi:unnamed protein product [Echinostoma caproni]|uniref:Kinesin motor domain-containing protein n=1 Tax=Echinostoma caproni TaxID=27848 RepID=A0A183AS69_9TREM|nr:unnamed protein product [Echinostoma caproni]
MDKPEECSHSVPPSPTLGLRSKRFGRVLYCVTPSNRERESEPQLQNEGVTDSSEPDKLAKTRKQEGCEHGPDCCCYLSESMSSSAGSQGDTDGTHTETEPMIEEEEAAGELSESSRTCSSLILAREQGESAAVDSPIEISKRVYSQRQTEFSSSRHLEVSRRSESCSDERNRRGLSSKARSCRPPRAQTHDRLAKTGISDPMDEGYRGEWPAPIPFRYGPSSHSTNHLTMDTVSVFKYRINYPNLMRWSYQFIHLYAKWQKEGTFTDEPNTKILIEPNIFVDEVLKKRAQKVKQMVVNSEDHVVFQSVKQSSTAAATVSPTRLLRNQLWKRRYYALLNAVDFVYKDYQLLHYVSKEGLFTFVSTPPVLPSGALRSTAKYLSNVWPSHINAIQNLATVGADPAGHLSERVTQVLLKRANVDGKRVQRPFDWPCLFQISVAFLSDVMAQGRILRCDLDRRLAVYDRLIYVLSQAREQRAKLRLHVSRQRELLESLASNLCAIQKQLSIRSPLLDRPASIRDGLSNDITSPLVEYEMSPHTVCRSGNLREKDYKIKEEKNKQASPERNKPDYLHRRTEIYAEISNLERVLREEEVRRKRMHNRIQELTGNIRVFCRLRPDDSLSNNQYLRVSSNDKLLFCSDTLKDQLQERKPTIPFAYHGMRTLTSGSTTTGIGANAVCSGTGVGTSSGISFGAPKCFIFDRVFGPRASQTEVYQEVDDLIVSCIDGYNVCIMAYGQTGSGKTYTMMGTEEEPGVNRRAIQSLFEHCDRRKHWKYSIFVSVVEIYQEDVFDLLEDANESAERSTGLLSSSTQTRSSPTTGQMFRKTGRESGCGRWRQPPNQSSVPWNTWTSRGPSTHSSGLGYFTGKTLRRRGSVRILSDQLDGVVLQNLHERPVHDETEMLYYLHLAEKQRRVGSTRLNICSSRSHLVILLKVIGEHQFHMTTSRGTLTLADLAGSENVTKSGSTGERFLEAACINKSLSSLGRVFDALRRQQKPTYRETKLTYLLRPTLSGESKCLLFVALRTEPEHAEETWRAIHFGQGALQVVPGGGNGGGVSITSTISANFESDRSVTKFSGPVSGPVTSFSYASGGLMMSPATLLHSIRGNTHRTRSRGKPKANARNSSSSNVVSYLPQSVYSMGPAITKRGWRKRTTTPADFSLRLDSVVHCVQVPVWSGAYASSVIRIP